MITKVSKVTFTALQNAANAYQQSFMSSPANMKLLYQRKSEEKTSFQECLEEQITKYKKDKFSNSLSSNLHSNELLNSLLHS